MKRFIYLFIFVSTILLISCDDDYINTTTPNSNIENTEPSLLTISYNMTTYIDYDINPITFSDLDLSFLNPSSEKQEVSMELFESGQLNITIEELDFKDKIKNPHQIAPDGSPKISKTIILGNSVSFYDKEGVLLNSEQIPIPNHMDLVNSIKEIGVEFSTEDINNAIATMQGHQFIENLEEFIKNIESTNNQFQKSTATDNITIIEQGENYVTLRMPLNAVEQGMSQVSVLLIDKTLNKIVGTRIYTDNNQLLQSTFFGYNTGEVKSLNAIKTIQKVTLLSGKEVDMITYSKIEDMKFNLNL